MFISRLVMYTNPQHLHQLSKVYSSHFKILYHRTRQDIVTPSKNLLQNSTTLQRRRQPNGDRIVLDPMLGIPSRASPQQDIDNARHGLVQRVVQEGGVAGPLVVEDSCGLTRLIILNQRRDVDVIVLGLMGLKCGLVRVGIHTG